MIEQLPLYVDGHLLMKDDLGNVLIDKHNAVHPQNMARVIARALAHEDNYYIYKIAFGNGGTVVDAAFQITYNPPHDGQPPDPETWKSQLYNMTYWEVVDDQSANIGEGPGAVPDDDPPSVPNVSGPGVRSTELGLTSQVRIECVLNQNEPQSEFPTDQNPPVESTESTFTFDEIGLWTSGAPQTATAGYQDVDVGTREADDDSGLAPSTAYGFNISVDGGAPQAISITTPAAGTGPLGAITYGDLVTLINASLIVGATASINGAPSSTINTFGFLRFTSASTGVLSAISLTDATGPVPLPLFAALNAAGVIMTAIPGDAAGVQNAPTAPATEAERLLTHLIFSPVLKSGNRTLTIVYTLTISVARST